jgi:GDP-L-fucose synthase
MRKIVVLGGFGFLGGNVVRAFARRRYAVEAASRQSGVDARNETTLAAFLARARADILVHCAAHVGGIAYNAQCPVAIYEDNLLLGHTVLRAAHRAGVQKLVNIMPNCTYPGEMELYREDRWWDGPMHPTVLTYGTPRKALWVEAWAYQQEHGFASIHLVLPNLYGPGDQFDIVRSHALGALIRKVIDAKLQGERRIDVWGTGNPVREWMYVEDAAEGIVRATERYASIEILNLGSGQGCSIRTLAEMIAEVAGWRGEFVYDASRPDGAPVKILDVAKTRAALDGWRPRTGLRDGIARTIRWYLAHRDALRGSRAVAGAPQPVESERG